MSDKVIVQQVCATDGDTSHYIAESTGDGEFTSLRRGEGEEWTAWARGEPLVDIASHGNGCYVDIHGNKDELVSLDLDYDTIADLYMALHEHFQQGRNKMILKRFKEI